MSKTEMMTVRVWFSQVNATYVDVEVPKYATQDQIDAVAIRKWRREKGYTTITDRAEVGGPV